MTNERLRLAVLAGEYDALLSGLYGAAALERQRARYAEALAEFGKLYGEREVNIFSAPGRSEISGNHTDHNNGKVIAAAVDLDVIAIVAKNDSGRVSVKSKGFDNTDVIELDKLGEVKKGVSCSRSLVAGMLARLSADGYSIDGFDAYTTSDVIRGSGLSSSAAFEVLIGTIISGLFNGGSLDPVYIAVAAQYAENVYFGKPCGLMDQTASSVGGFIGIDFGDPAAPKVSKIDFDFASCGHALCVVDTGGSHANLTDEYAAIPAEMKSVAAYFGKSVLREVDEAEFIAAIPRLRGTVGDRAILRALHYFNENRRVDAQRAALERGDFAEFLRLLNESGRSSYMFNQNVYCAGEPREQGIALALAAAERVLDGKGGFRVHGGGFAGTMQAFVPIYLLASYKEAMENIFGAGSCKVLSVRKQGGVRVI
ncbi:MAG: galactokinase [Clostridia bacterium]|nr:galactokinase [Clostridia bacterium]